MRYTVDEIKEIVSALAAQYGADRIYLFGFYARGDADKDSDIDLIYSPSRLQFNTSAGASCFIVKGDCLSNFLSSSI